METPATEIGISAENKALVRRWIKEIWNKGNLRLVDELVVANYVNNDPAAPMPESGREGFKKHVAVYRRAFPDLELSIDDIAADGNKVTVRWTARGTHQGVLMGIEPTGRRIETPGISIISIEGGKVAEQWVNWDTFGMMKQLSAVPAIGQATGQAAK